ncbi:MAG TPA: glutaredoxin [Kosmotogaceae bacterium]|nr:MAG: Glutaredoxin-like domain protein [Thermotogales bacterium 46_20]HAA85022.1 glutaredoxin [Kosmotogaceae bacterium]
MSDKLLDKEIRKQVEEVLSNMKDRISVVFFVSEERCEFCETIEKLLGELTELTDKLEVRKASASGEEARSFEIEMTPAVIPLTAEGNDKGVRFYGIPSGHEFGTLLKTLVDFSAGATPDISEKTLKRLDTIKQPVDIKVFVTTSCPYCPKAVLTAFKFALANSNVTASMVEASEFEELSKRFGVSSVPQIVINSSRSFVGAYPEEQYLDEVMKAVAR